MIFRSEQLEKARSAYYNKKKRDKAHKASDSDTSDNESDDSVSSSLSEHKGRVKLAKEIRDKAKGGIAILESEIEEHKCKMKKEEAMETKMEAYLRMDAHRPRHAPSQPSRGDDELKHQVLGIIQRYEGDHGRYKSPDKEDIMKEMNVSESARADQASVQAIKKALIELEREGEIGMERSDAGYDIYYAVNDDMEGDGYEEALDPSACATDNAVQRSSEEAEMEEDLHV